MLNKVILIGNLTRDIELRYTPTGTAVAKTGLAVNRRFKGQNGEQKDETMFIDLTIFGRSAEIANQYCKKGSKVCIEGRLVLEQWTDQNGQNRSKHSIAVENLQFLDSKDQTSEGRATSVPVEVIRQNNITKNNNVQARTSEDSIPFWP